MFKSFIAMFLAPEVVFYKNRSEKHLLFGAILVCKMAVNLMQILFLCAKWLNPRRYNMIC
jgi:ABC-type proline/glycine betaine transport system permease subunit